MKFTKLFLLLFTVGVFATSCDKCVVCNCPASLGGDIDEYCQSDFDSKDEYDQTVSFARGLGCTCN